MPSPFPGMDPYLEGELWQEFHETLASAIRAQLVRQLAPHYVALLAKRYVLDRPALGVFDAPTTRIIYPDVHVVAPSVYGGGTGVQKDGGAAAATVELPNFLEVPLLGVEIRDVADRRLITAIEILSPANKWGVGRASTASAGTTCSARRSICSESISCAAAHESACSVSRRQRLTIST